MKADGNHGKVDNLHISYGGNRITTVLEDADAVAQSGCFVRCRVCLTIVVFGRPESEFYIFLDTSLVFSHIFD